MTIYLDCNATTPLAPEVVQIVRHYMELEYGNAGSRTHEFGASAKSAVEKARGQVADVVAAQKDEVLFTSGATESNNLAILGLAAALKAKNQTHIITTSIEHKAVLEPCMELAKQGFTVTYLEPDSRGSIRPEQVLEALEERVGLVSVMHVNNETGAIQPVAEIADLLADHNAYLHVDAAQSFGKLVPALKHPRIDLLSISGHKIYGPKGIGALVTRRREYKRPPLAPLLFGGGQEKGLRPGTLPVALIAGLGLAAQLLREQKETWWQRCSEVKAEAMDALKPLAPSFHGGDTMPNVINCSIAGVNSEAAIVALKDVAAISNGSACTSSSYTPSHVLQAMHLSEEDIKGALRVSWCHTTEAIPWDIIVERLQSLR